jgi:hypothetical protein
MYLLGKLYDITDIVIKLPLYTTTRSTENKEQKKLNPTLAGGVLSLYSIIC